MGFLSSFMGSMGAMIGDQLYPVYQNAHRFDTRALENIVTDNTNKIYVRTVHLLVLMEKNRYRACELYKQNKHQFDNGLASIYNCRKFQRIIDEFRRIVAGSNY